MYILNKQQAL